MTDRPAWGTAPGGILKSARKTGVPGHGAGKEAPGAVGVICAVPMFWVGPSCDNWNFNASNPCLYVGGNYNQNGNYGLFYVNYNTASNTSSNIGSRHLRRRSAPPNREGRELRGTC